MALARVELKPLAVVISLLVALIPAATACGPDTAEAGDWGYAYDCDYFIFADGEAGDYEAILATSEEACDALCALNAVPLCALQSNGRCWAYLPTATDGCTPGVPSAAYTRWEVCGVSVDGAAVGAGGTDDEEIAAPAADVATDDSDADADPTVIGPDVASDRGTVDASDESSSVEDSGDNDDSGSSFPVAAVVVPIVILLLLGACVAAAGLLVWHRRKSQSKPPPGEYVPPAGAPVDAYGAPAYAGAPGYGAPPTGGAVYGVPPTGSGFDAYPSGSYGAHPTGSYAAPATGTPAKPGAFPASAPPPPSQFSAGAYTGAAAPQPQYTGGAPPAQHFSSGASPPQPQYTGSSAGGAPPAPQYTGGAPYAPQYTGGAAAAPPPLPPQFAGGYSGAAPAAQQGGGDGAYAAGAQPQYAAPPSHMVTQMQ